ncbi:RNA-directed DNA polymerase from mobile element jockey [Paramuricea clavata]|uniref:RNA-directed DNA polymerase from mobile element jockey n=1 Tax=Paramuricea clavata TaxID=317549 RepID=A0A7D9LLL7_PARCT|nr:RNA-directed DNA polymerase from mobile element jockey [Paramuricea clavata]
MLLPSDHDFTNLVVLHCNTEVMHNGVRETVTQVRSRYWIVRGRQVVKKIIARCLTYKPLEGKSYEVPPAPPLSEYRLDNDVAFSRVGVDYAGPLFVKNIYSKDSKMYKAYIVLYTCASSRAVYLDLAVDATSETFIRSFKRFMSRRGIPATMISDNGKTFK